MEADFEERAKKRKRNRKVAVALKEKGNMCLKKGLYKSANKHYSDAIEEAKDMLPLYTNRALTRLRLELWQDAVDDCTRVLEYAEVFDECYTKNLDLNYKALVRRGQALRGLKDFEYAIQDLEEAAKLIPEEKDPQRLIEQYKSDWDLEKRIDSIMANAESLSGKEYIDFILLYLQGKGEQPEAPPTNAPKKLPKFCKNELKKTDSDKLNEILNGENVKQNEDLILYFNAKDGFKILVDSLEFNMHALEILTKVLPQRESLKEDFQRQHLYEALVDFMHKRNVNAEGATLDP